MLERNSTQVASTALAIQNVVMPSTDELYMSNELDMRSTPTATIPPQYAARGRQKPMTMLFFD